MLEAEIASDPGRLRAALEVRIEFFEHALASADELQKIEAARMCDSLRVQGRRQEAETRQRKIAEAAETVRLSARKGLQACRLGLEKLNGSKEVAL